MLAVMAQDSTVSSNAAILEFDHVSFVIPDGPTILDRVSLEVGAGQISVIAGPSGSGKSTLLRLGNRLEVPTSGVVRFRGTDLDTCDPLALRRTVGMVFQKPVPFPGTVRANLLIADSSASDRLLKDVLVRVGLDESVLERVADELSGGEAQRMCIARTLLTSPSVILMDEPTSALDPESRLGIEALAGELASEGIALVWVTHDLDQAQRIADRIVVIVEGRNAGEVEANAYLNQQLPKADE